MVNISHALQSTAVEKIRSDIKDLQQVAELTLDQKQTINKYIESLNAAFAQFTKDNEHVERSVDKSITAADTQLYMGLKGMYTDYLSQLERIRQEKSTDVVNAKASNESVLHIIKEELPTKHAKERRLYIDKLIKNYPNDKLPKKSVGLVQSIIKLCSLDSDFTPTLKSYVHLLKMMGYKYEAIKKYVPQDLDNLMSELFDKGSTKNEEISSLMASNGDSQNALLDDEPKKKISFSKYLKKGDEVVNENNKRESSKISEITSRPAKIIKKNNKGIGSNSGTKVSLNSILKTSGSSRSKRSSTGIRFEDDSQLVRVYGYGLPNEGLKVSPEELKKVLKPFKEGEPREALLIKNYEGKAKELDIEFDMLAEQSDISELKGGPIPCDTAVPLKYRKGFSNFTSDLGNKPAREPVIIDDLNENSKNLKGPLIMKAFGKNSLLLRKDRGGIPYRRIPDVVPINYPPRPVD